MNGATVVAGTPGVAASPAGGAVLPFWYGSNVYARKFNTTTVTLTTATSPQEFNVPPQGYLSNVRLEVRSTGGSGGTVANDGVWTVFQSAELDDVDGANILYPQSGFSHMLGNKYFRPWNGDPNRRWDFANSANPSFTMDLRPELRHTAGCLANTDARSQYKLAYTVNTLANVITASATAPACAISAYLEVWAQPDTTDLQKNQISPVPPGLALQTKRRNQVSTLNAAGANNTLQLSLTGNELRGVILVVRDSTQARQDYLSDPVNVMLDNRNLGVFSPNEVFNLMNDFYVFLQDGTSVRETGVYVFPRFYDPGRMQGQAWLETTNATFLVFESSTSGTATSVPGTVQLIVDETIPVAPMDPSLDSI